MPVREFLHTESGGALVLVAATVLALVWANVVPSSYDSVWTTQLSVRVGALVIGQDFRHWINNGLMAFFFLVVSLEARREFDLGELRDRRRLAFPAAAALGGMLLPVGIYLLLNGGLSSAHGWGVAMSTDTAFALGVLALVGRRFPSSLRTLILTIAVVDDIVAFAVIGLVYTHHLSVTPLLVGIAALMLVLLARTRGIRSGLLYATLCVAAWVAILESGVDPVVVGVVLGLASMAYPAARSELEQASDLFRTFREQPTSEYAYSLREGVRTAISPNERLQQLYHPLTSYLIVPLFALANAGIAIDGAFLSRAYTAPITLGVLLGYVLGKPAGIAVGTKLVTSLSRGRARPPVGWGSILGGGSSAGIGFTASLLIATLAFTGTDLVDAKIGVLSAGVCASLLTLIVLQLTRMLPEKQRLRAIVGGSPALVDLASPVDGVHDHVRGSDDAPVTLVEYGDFECMNCGRAEPVIRRLLADFGDLRYVWRHLPLNDVHAHAQVAAEAAEAAAKQGRFWEMYDLLFAHQDALEQRDLMRYAGDLGLDVERFREGLRKRKFAARVAEDIESADLSGVSGTPTFFINGHRHHGAYDITTLTAEVRAARARAVVNSSEPDRLHRR